MNKKMPNTRNLSDRSEIQSPRRNGNNIELSKPKVIPPKSKRLSRFRGNAPPTCRAYGHTRDPDSGKNRPTKARVGARGGLLIKSDKIKASDYHGNQQT
jgi:hypothetical protein